MAADPQPHAFTPQPGMQQSVLDSDVEDIFIGGARGAGRTVAALMAWLRHRRENGPSSRGVFITSHFPPTPHWVAGEAMSVFGASGAKYLSLNRECLWPDGSRLLFRGAVDIEDTWRFFGYSASFRVFDNAHIWQTSDVVDAVSLALSPVPGIPTKRIITGVPMPGLDGADWLRSRYVTAATAGVPFKWCDPGSRCGTTTSVFISASMKDNVELLRADPNFYERMIMSGYGDNDLWGAWRDGDWKV